MTTNNNVTSPLSSNIDNFKTIWPSDIETEFVNYIEDKNKGVFHKTNFYSLDNVIEGITNNKYYVLGARPGGGKTTLATNIAYSISSQLEENEYILFLSLEMQAFEIWIKIISMISKVEHIDISKKQLTEAKLNKISGAIQTLRNSKIVVMNSETQNYEDILKQIEIVKKQQKGKVLKGIFIDYLQLLKGDNKLIAYERLGEISKALRLKTINDNIFVFALVQLNRESAGARSSIPQLSQIKESGSIEQDADVVMLLYEKQNKETSARYSTKDINVKIAKNRLGELATITLQFNGAICQFTDNNIPYPPNLYNHYSNSSTKVSNEF